MNMIIFLLCQLTSLTHTLMCQNYQQFTRHFMLQLTCRTFTFSWPIMLQNKPHTEPATVLITDYFAQKMWPKRFIQEEFIIITTTNIIHKEHSKVIICTWMVTLLQQYYIIFIIRRIHAMSFIICNWCLVNSSTSRYSLYVSTFMCSPQDKHGCGNSSPTCNKIMCYATTHLNV
jgi:hypothetical protein